MKTLIYSLFVIIGIQLLPFNGVSQESGNASSDSIWVKVTKNDGVVYVGELLFDNSREVGIKTKEIGEVIIPKYEVKSIEYIEKENLSKSGEVMDCQFLPSRYTFTASGFPVKKGEGYLRIMPVGADFQFPVTDNWSIGGLSTWYGVPMFLTSKIGTKTSEKSAVSAGFIYGNLLHGSLFADESVFSIGGGIGFGAITFGTEVTNINFSGGYGFYHFSNEIAGTGMFSIGGAARISNQAQFVFDSMGLIANGEIYYWLNPGVRYAPKKDKIWQFGIHMGGNSEILLPLPMPSVSFTKVFYKK